MLQKFILSEINLDIKFSEHLIKHLKLKNTLNCSKLCWIYWFFSKHLQKLIPKSWKNVNCHLYFGKLWWPRRLSHWVTLSNVFGSVSVVDTFGFFLSWQMNFFCNKLNLERITVKYGITIFSTRGHCSLVRVLASFLGETSQFGQNYQKISFFPLKSLPRPNLTSIPRKYLLNGFKDPI